VGYARNHPSVRISRRLRSVRKASARITGLHGLLSGKNRHYGHETDAKHPEEHLNEGDEHRSHRRRHRKRKRRSDLEAERERRRLELARLDRVREIDRQIAANQELFLKLVTEKDILQKRPNPLWNYTSSLTLDATGELEPSEETTASRNDTFAAVEATRVFQFPPGDLVDEYLEVLVANGRLHKLNHTDLWRASEDEIDDDDDDDPVIFRNFDDEAKRRKRGSNGDSGNWFLRHGLGEKVGEAAENAAYKSVCSAVMRYVVPIEEATVSQAG
jgi:hypothetical protein